MKIRRVLSLLVLLAMMLPLMPSPPAYAMSTTGWLWPVDKKHNAINRGYYYVSKEDHHYGIDIDVSIGKTVKASKAGKVIKTYTGCVSRSVASTGNKRTCPTTLPDGRTCKPNCDFKSYTIKTKTGAIIKSYKACNYGYGNGVVIRHNDGSISMYAHMSEVFVEEGSDVYQGQPIGKSGSTGNSAGQHLHFALGTGYSRAGTYISPKRVSNNPYSVESRIKLSSSGNSTGLSKSGGYVYNNNGVSYIFEETPEPGKPTLTVEPGTNLTETAFSWNSPANTEYCTLRIYHSNGEIYALHGGLSTGARYSWHLPEGSYTATLAAVNNTYGTWTFSDTVSFTVSKDSATNAPGKPTLWVTAGSNLSETYLHWSETGNTTYYTLRIFDASDNLYLLQGGIRRTNFYAILPPGRYKARLCSVNKQGDNWTYADDVSFTVGSQSVSNLGNRVDAQEANHKVYNLYSRNYTNWLSARKLAEDNGGKLATIANEEEQEAVAALVTAYGRPCWLGSEVFSNHGWRWIDGRSYTYNNWGDSQPDNGYGVENVLRMLPGGEWDDSNDIKDYNSMGYVVEYEPLWVSVFNMTDTKLEGEAVTQGDLMVMVSFADNSLWNTTDYEITSTGTSLGEQTITVHYGALTAQTTIEYVTRRRMQASDFTLPAGIKVIGEEAFRGLDMQVVKCPEGLEEIGRDAFADCPRLREIYIPESVEMIAEDICGGCAEGLAVFGHPFTAAQDFANAFGYPFIMAD